MIEKMTYTAAGAIAVVMGFMMFIWVFTGLGPNKTHLLTPEMSTTLTLLSLYSLVSGTLLLKSAVAMRGE